MAKDTSVTKAGAAAAVDALVDRLDTGTGTATLKIYDGTKPANADTAVGTQTVLASFNLPATAFGAASTTANGASATVNTATLTDTSADAGGTAAWFRCFQRNGTTVGWDGTVGTTTDFDMQIDNTSISAGQTVKVTQWKVRLPNT